MSSLDDSQSRILALDFGSNGLTIGLYNPHTNEFEAFGEGRYEYLAPSQSGYREQEPDSWLQAMPVAMQQIRDRVDLSTTTVIAIALGAHMHGLVLLDEGQMPVKDSAGRTFPCIMWDDRRGETEGQALSQLLSQPIAARMTASRLKWFIANHANIWKQQVARVCVPSSFIALRLTGEFGVGAGDASGMFGQLKGGAGTAGFDEATLAKIDPLLPGRVPRVGVAGDCLGRLNAQGAALLGLPEGIPVAFPEGDQPVGMVASGCLSPSARVSMSLGQSAVLNAVGKQPILEHRGIVDSFRTVTNDHLLMTCVTNGVLVVEELLDCFSEFWQGKRDDLREHLMAMARREPPGCAGVLAIPFYLGEGSFRQPQAFASFLGLRKGQLRPGVLLRATLEANAAMLAIGFDRMGSKGVTAKEIYLSGGGSRSDLWAQIIADMFQLPVRKPRDADEAATRGAAYLALQMLERMQGRPVDLADIVAERIRVDEDPVRPSAKNESVYNELKSTFLESLEQVKPLFARPWFSHVR